MKKKTRVPKALPPKKPNPQDATLRNIRALKKRAATLQGEHEALLEAFSCVLGMVVAVSNRVAALESWHEPKVLARAVDKVKAQQN